jgi:hypothetical protein
MTTFRCNCGVWTTYGMTCVACRQEAYKNMRPPAKDTESAPEIIEVIDEEALEEEDY